MTKHLESDVNLGSMRIPYKSSQDTFTEDKLASLEPMGQFDSWFKEASLTPGISEPNAMCLSTASREGRPSSRMVLLKGYGPEGFKFFTNYDSRKGKEITDNPFGALNFYWEPLKRSVRVEGQVSKLSEEESEEYFNSRPYSSQIGAAISPQSQVISGRDFLTTKEQELKAKTSVERPNHWGGYVLTPEMVEFWQGQTTRIHDRIRFRKPAAGESVDEKLTKKGEDGWVYERLAP